MNVSLVKTIVASAQCIYGNIPTITVFIVVNNVVVPMLLLVVVMWVVASIYGARHHQQLLRLLDQALPSLGIGICSRWLVWPHHNILQHAHSDSRASWGLSERAGQHLWGYKSASVINGIVIPVLGIAILSWMILAGKICPYIAGMHTLYYLICVIHFRFISILNFFGSLYFLLTNGDVMKFKI